ncbi:MAG: glycosyltransferase [Prevotella sp.]|nr:glycosyltransferase [Prevotella sp.]
MTGKEADYKPLVSFIIPCYNLSAALITACLDSILCLSLKPYEREIIVVDDGSKKPLKDLLTDYHRDIIVIRQENQGLSAARNTGISVAKGRYIQFVDGDDKLLREAYRHCLNIVRQQQPDMLIFQFTDKENPHSKRIRTQETDATSYMQHNNIHAAAWSYIFKREILGDLRFTIGILHEDEEFTPRLLLRADKIVNTDITAYFYRSRPVSITHDNNKRMLVKRMNDMEGIICHLHVLSLSLSSNKRLALERRVAQITMDYIYNIIKITRLSTQLRRRIERLRRKGLFPLPCRNYTLKYTLFRMFFNNNITRKLFSYIALK